LSIYIATFIAHSFCIAVAIAAHFNLKIEQFIIITAFINKNCLLKSALIAYLLLDNFKQLSIYIKVNRALYKLKDSFAL
jgi:hypothetical protein